MSSANIVLYGINSITDILLKQNPSALLVTTDGNESYNGKEVLSLQELANDHFNTIEKIIICSMFVDDIANSLLEAGFELSILSFYNIAHCQVMACANSILQVKPTDKTLHVIYDMKTNLPCYDALSFAAVAEAEKTQRGLKYIHFYILSSEGNDNKLSFSSNYQEHDRAWRISNIVRPIFESLPSYIATTHLLNLDDLAALLAPKKHIFPQDILIKRRGSAYGLPALEKYINADIPLLELSIAPTAENMVRSMLLTHNATKKKLITLTLRNTLTHPERNSPSEPWVQFLETLDRDKFFPVVIRDTSESMNKSTFSELALELPAASINFQIRIALYDASYINLSSSGGPSFAYYFIKNCSSIRYSPIDDSHFATSRKNVERAGFKIGQEQFFAQNGIHQIPYEVETFESISLYFDRQCHTLENESSDV